MTNRSWTRREFLGRAAWAGGALLVYGPDSGGLLAAPRRLEPTLACDDDPSGTPPLTPGPFYTPDAPRKSDFRGDGPGDPIQLGGLVLDTRCQPLPDATVELWHADAHGGYDRQGYRFRGHVRTGTDGGYRFDTIRPGRYGSRTRHYHVRIRSHRGRLLTTQLYFPDEPRNRRDWLFREPLLVTLDETDGATFARFDFVVENG